MKSNHVTALMALALLLASCTRDGVNTTPTNTGPTASASGAVTPSATRSTTSASSASAEAQAADAVIRLWGVLDRLASNPQAPLSELTRVARGQALAQWQGNLTQMRGGGLKQVGDVTVEEPTVTYDAAVQVFRVFACVDVSKVNVVDQTGKSVVAANRAPRTKYAYEVSSSEGGYFVTKDPLRGDSC